MPDGWSGRASQFWPAGMENFHSDVAVGVGAGQAGQPFRKVLLGGIGLLGRVYGLPAPAAPPKKSSI
jgi:hypothetical protein